MSATSPPKALSPKSRESSSHARATRTGDRAPTQAGGLDALRVHAREVIADIVRARKKVEEFLAEHPSSRVAHHAAALTHLQNAIALTVVEAREREERATERDRRRAENARDRALRNWEPHQIRAAQKMGFADPADWRRYIDEREAHGEGFPSPDEWRRERGIE